MSEASADEEGSSVGYRSPPRRTRFQKGTSGNPKGRPRNRKKDIPYDTVLGQMVTIREDGRERRVTAAEAFLLHLTRKGLAGDNAAARASLGAIEAARENRAQSQSGDNRITQIRIVFMGFGVGSVLATLGIGRKMHPLDESRVHWLLQPWIVQAALKRLGATRLSVEEQREVWKVTRNPDAVEWPGWWTERGG